MTRRDDWSPSFGVDENEPTPTPTYRPTTPTELDALMQALRDVVQVAGDRRAR